MLKGSVGVKVPTDVVVNCKNYFDILRYQTSYHDSIIKYKDNHSRIVKKFLDMFNKDILMRIESIQMLKEFLEMWLQMKQEADKK